MSDEDLYSYTPRLPNADELDAHARAERIRRENEEERLLKQQLQQSRLQLEQEARTREEFYKAELARMAAEKEAALRKVLELEQQQLAVQAKHEEEWQRERSALDEQQAQHDYQLQMDMLRLVREEQEAVIAAAQRRQEELQEVLVEQQRNPLGLLHGSSWRPSQFTGEGDAVRLQAATNSSSSSNGGGVGGNSFGSGWRPHSARSSFGSGSNFSANGSGPTFGEQPPPYALSALPLPTGGPSHSLSHSGSDLTQGASGGVSVATSTSSLSSVPNSSSLLSPLLPPPPPTTTTTTSSASTASSHFASSSLTASTSHLTHGPSPLSSSSSSLSSATTAAYAGRYPPQQQASAPPHPSAQAGEEDWAAPPPLPLDDSEKALKGGGRFSVEQVAHALGGKGQAEAELSRQRAGSLQKEILLELQPAAADVSFWPTKEDMPDGQLRRCSECFDEIKEVKDGVRQFSGRACRKGLSYYHAECYYSAIAPHCQSCGASLLPNAKEGLSGRWGLYQGRRFHVECFQKRAGPRCIHCHDVVFANKERGFSGFWRHYKDGGLIHEECFHKLNKD